MNSQFIKDIVLGEQHNINLINMPTYFANIDEDMKTINRKRNQRVFL